MLPTAVPPLLLLLLAAAAAADVAADIASRDVIGCVGVGDAACQLPVGS